MASVIRKARVFKNGGSKAIRLPKEFDIPGNEVIIKQDLGVLTIHPKRARKGSLLALLRAIGPIDLAPREQPQWSDPRDDPELRPAKRARRRR